MKKKPKKTPGRAAVLAWKAFFRLNEPKMRELIFQAFLNGVRTGQANPKVDAHPDAHMTTDGKK